MTLIPNAHVAKVSRHSPHPACLPAFNNYLCLLLLRGEVDDHFDRAVAAIAEEFEGFLQTF